ncbi:porin family protein [Flavobacterium sp. J49]|uniref:outer membrane beta-barrel protein n=1 Tax=Flavobacterium sp. J49 TaxID=2718534 RepID=UPI001593EC21|nr:outer membrane beta-barrel protein [Flavobacterium sp. J49]MBF6641078.1 porin family protein [Flavobacterium sp. J49]NIC02325.1 porin family protein [Flavobacterium sp. J49]
MKKIILTVAAVFAFGFANAQDKKEGSEGFSKGDLYLSGTFNFSNSKTGDFKTDSFTVAPGLGYFLTENLAIEGSLGFTSGKETLDITGDGDFFEVKSSGFGINAGVKYFWTPASKFSLSVGGNVSYASIKAEVDGLGESTSKIMGLNVPVGLHYFVSDKFAITTSWGGFAYSSNDNGGNGAEKTNTFDLGLDLSEVSFGLIYKL